jgi:hypothetical protein
MFLVVGDGSTIVNNSGHNYIGVGVDMMVASVHTSGQLYLFTNIGHGGNFTGSHTTPSSIIDLAGGPSAFTMGHEFWISWLITRNLDGTITHAAKAWWDGDAEPSSYSATYTDASTAMGPINTVNFEAFTFDGLGAGQQFAIDSIDITGVNRCTEYRFDNFSRTVSGGCSWGTSDYGTAYGIFDCPNVEVTGNQGVLSYVGPPLGGTSEAGIEIPGVPFLAPGSSWTFACRVSFDDATNAVFNRLDFYGWAGTNFPYLGLFPGNDFIRLGDAEDYTFAFEDGVKYEVRWSHTPTEMKVKVWAAATTEPDWLVTVASSPMVGTPSNIWSITYLMTRSVPLVARFDYIDFDYAGKPCYVACSDTVLDDFARTVAPDGWGVASSGPTWIMYDSPTVSVGSGVGTLHSASTGSLTGVILPSSDPLFPTDLRYGHDVDMTFRFRVSAFATTGINPDDLNIYLFQGALQFYVNPTTEVGWGQLALQGNSPSTDYSIDFTDWAAATWYDLRVAYVSGVAKAKIWRAADPEPDWMLTHVEALNMAGLDDSLTVLVEGGGVVNATFDFDHVTYNTCTPVLP